MTAPRAVRLRTVVAVALAFGLAAAWVKGQDTDGCTGLAPLRAAFGNLSAPWLALPFWAGVGRRRWPAAALGLAATLTALLAFYALTGLVVGLDGRSFPADVPLWVRANRAYVEAGLLSGPLTGLLGCAWSLHRRPRRLVLAGLLLLAEPLALLGLGLLRPLALAGGPAALRLLPGWGLGVDAGPVRLSVYLVEVVLGVLLLARARRSRAAG